MHQLGCAEGSHTTDILKWLCFQYSGHIAALITRRKGYHYILTWILLLSMSHCASLDTWCSGLYLCVASLQKFYLPFSKYCALYSWSNYTAYKGTASIKLGLFLMKKRSTQKCCRSEAASFYLCSVSFLILIAKSLWRCAFTSKFRTWPMLSSSHEMLHQMYSFTSNVHTKIGWLKSRSVLFSQMANCS